MLRLSYEMQISYHASCFYSAHMLGIEPNLNMQF